MLRILTFNANGIRSAAKKGFFEWFMKQNADILCIQELKAQEADLSDELKSLPGYHGFFHCARKKGIPGAVSGRDAFRTLSALVSEMMNSMQKDAALRRISVVLPLFLHISRQEVRLTSGSLRNSGFLSALNRT